MLSVCCAYATAYLLQSDSRYMSIHMSIHMSILTSIHLSIHPSIHPSIHQANIAVCGMGGSNGARHSWDMLIIFHLLCIVH